jgi:hypothetical protein
MKKINELKSERSDIVTKMEEISKTETLTDTQRSSWNDLDNQVKTIDDTIVMLERQEQLNLNNIKKVETIKEKHESAGESFRNWLVDSVNKGITSTFHMSPEWGLDEATYRAEPIITSTDTGMITKTVNAGIDIVTSPAEAFLRTLGCSFFTGLVGNFTVPSMAEDTATFPGEDVSTALASMGPSSLTLAARRVTHRQAITRETLTQTNPGVYASILQNLINGVWNAITNDAFDTLESDGTGRYLVTGTTATYANILALEASVGYFNMTSPAIVTTPSGKALFKAMATVSSVAGPAWNGNEMNGYVAYGVPAANANRVYFGDFSKLAIAQWAPIEIVVDPFTQAANGRIVLTAIGLADTGNMNPRAFAFLDASL